MKLNTHKIGHQRTEKNLLLEMAGILSWNANLLIDLKSIIYPVVEEKCIVEDNNRRAASKHKSIVKHSTEQLKIA